jgi:hypothetical protein
MLGFSTGCSPKRPSVDTKSVPLPTELLDRYAAGLLGPKRVAGDAIWTNTSQYVLWDFMVGSLHAGPLEVPVERKSGSAPGSSTDFRRHVMSRCLLFT